MEDAPWDDYETANRHFAEAALPEVEDGGVLWVHDYHLMRAPLLLRNSQLDATIAWFCHVPWPDPDQFATLPWRKELVHGVLGADLVGFHTRRYAEHFLACAEAFAGATVDRNSWTAVKDELRTRVVVAPIGIPTQEVTALVGDPELESRRQQLRQSLDGRRIVLGVDRLDYTKGIVERLSAFARLLERKPELCEQVVFVQIVVPSRETVDAYAQLKRTVDRAVGELNGRFSRAGCIPVHYHYANFEPRELYAHYRAADVALVTPLRDGMNLVALEYVAARTDGDGALVLSEFAGAAEHLVDAYLVNPYDVDAVATTLQAALDAPAAERRRRMQRLRSTVSKLDVHGWADGFLKQLLSSGS
jgi:trehalose 6-phosphate synthase/phosphatase